LEGFFRQVRIRCSRAGKLLDLGIFPDPPQLVKPFWLADGD